MSGKTSTKKPNKTIDELEDSLADLGDDAKALREKVQSEVDGGPKFDEPEDRAPAPSGELVGRRVKFDGETDGQEGTITTAEPNGAVVIVDDSGTEWNSEVGHFQFVEAPAKKTAPAAPEPEDRAPAGIPAEETKVETPAAPAEETKAETKKGAKGKGKAPKAEAVEAPKATEAPAEKVETVEPPTPNELVYDVRVVKVADVKVPKLYPRRLAKDSPEYQRIFRDLKNNPQEEAIVLDSWDKKTLVEGLTRLSIFQDLGRKMIFARVKAGITTDGQRLFQGVRLNHQRNAMHWTDYAKAFANLIADGEFKQGEIAKEFDINPSEVSRMIASVQLPKKVLEKAREVDDEGKEKYSQSVVLELTVAPPKARAQAIELMEKDTKLTTVDVRELAKSARKAEDEAAVEKGETPPARIQGGARPRETKAATYVDLSVKETGEYVHFRVYGDRVEVTLTIPHENRTFRGFELVKAIKETISDSYANKELPIRSEADLVKALSEARAKLTG